MAEKLDPKKIVTVNKKGKHKKMPKKKKHSIGATSSQLRVEFPKNSNYFSIILPNTIHKSKKRNISEAEKDKKDID